MQEFPNPHFFSPRNIGGHPLPEIQGTTSPQRLSAVQCRNDISHGRQTGSAVSKRSLSVRQCQTDVYRSSLRRSRLIHRLSTAAQRRDICPLCGYPARHPSIVAHFFKFVKKKFKKIYKKTRRLSVPRGHLSGLATNCPVPIGTAD